MDRKYREDLISNVIKALEQLHPRANEMRSATPHEKCPSCFVEDVYYRVPEFKYGRCTECSYEVGFDYYDTVMGNRLAEYNDVVEKVKVVLGK